MSQPESALLERAFFDASLVDNYTPTSDLQVAKNAKVDTLASKKRQLLGTDELSLFDSRRIEQRQEGYLPVNTSGFGTDGSTIISGVSSGYYPKELVDQYTKPQETTPVGGLPAIDEGFREKVANGVKEAEADRMGILGRGVNALKAVPTAFGKELVVDTADWVGETLGKATGGTVGWDVGTENEKTKMMDNLFGYNRTFEDRGTEEGKIYATNIAKALSDEKQDVKWGDVGNLLKVGLETPEVLTSSLGTLAALMVGFGKFTKTGQAIGDIEKSVKAGTVTTSEAKEGVAAIKAAETTSQLATRLGLQNTGLLTVAAGNVNDEIDDFKKNNNEVSPTAGQVTRMMATEVLNLGLDRFTDMNILRTPEAVKDLVNVAKWVPKEGAGKIVGGVVTGAAKLAAAGGVEAAQEYTQTMMEVFNKQFETSKYGSGVEGVKNILTDVGNNTEAILGAGFGAAMGAEMKAGGMAVKGPLDYIQSRTESHTEAESEAPTEARSVLAPFNDQVAAVVEKNTGAVVNHIAGKVAANVDTKTIIQGIIGGYKLSDGDNVIAEPLLAPAVDAYRTADKTLNDYLATLTPEEGTVVGEYLKNEESPLPAGLEHVAAMKEKLDSAKYDLVESTKSMFSGASESVLTAAYSSIGSAAKSAKDLDSAVKSVMDIADNASTLRLTSGINLVPTEEVAKALISKYNPKLVKGSVVSNVNAADAALEKKNADLVEKLLAIATKPKPVTAEGQVPTDGASFVDLPNNVNVEHTTDIPSNTKTSKVGWKTPLAVKPENIPAVQKFLENSGMLFKVGKNGDQTGKDITIYHGGRDVMTHEHNLLSNIEHLLEPQQADSDSFKENMRVTDKLYPRFDATIRDTDGDPKYMRYGGNGVGALASRFSNIQYSNLSQAEKSKEYDKLHEEAVGLLTKDYGEFFTGTTKPQNSAGSKPKAAPLDLLDDPEFAEVLKLGSDQDSTRSLISAGISMLSNKKYSDKDKRYVAPMLVSSASRYLKSGNVSKLGSDPDTIRALVTAKLLDKDTDMNGIDAETVATVDNLYDMIKSTTGKSEETVHGQKIGDITNQESAQYYYLNGKLDSLNNLLKTQETKLAELNNGTDTAVKELLSHIESEIDDSVTGDARTKAVVKELVRLKQIDDKHKKLPNAPTEVAKLAGRLKNRSFLYGVLKGEGGQKGEFTVPMYALLELAAHVVDPSLKFIGNKSINPIKEGSSYPVISTNTKLLTQSVNKLGTLIEEENNVIRSMISALETGTTTDFTEAVKATRPGAKKSNGPTTFEDNSFDAMADQMARMESDVDVPIEAKQDTQKPAIHEQDTQKPAEKQKVEKVVEKGTTEEIVESTVDMLSKAAYDMYKNSEGSLTLAKAKDKAVASYLSTGKKQGDLLNGSQLELFDDPAPNWEGSKVELGRAVMAALLQMQDERTGGLGPTASVANKLAVKATKDLVAVLKKQVTADKKKRKELLKDTWRARWKDAFKGASVSVKMEDGQFLTSQGVVNRKVGNQVISQDEARENPNFVQMLKEFVGYDEFSDELSAIALKGIAGTDLSKLKDLEVQELDRGIDVTESEHTKAKARLSSGKAKQLDLFTDVKKAEPETKVKPTEKSKEEPVAEQGSTAAKEKSTTESEEPTTESEEPTVKEKKPVVRPKDVKKTAAQTEAELVKTAAQVNKDNIKVAKKKVRTLEGVVSNVAGKDASELLEAFYKDDTATMVNKVSRVAVRKAFRAMMAGITIRNNADELLPHVLDELENMKDKPFMSGAEVKSIVSNLKEYRDVLSDMTDMEALTDAIDDIITATEELDNCK
jgi:hypothetical protein